MGYYSRFRVHIEDRRESPAVALEAFRGENENAAHCLGEDGTPEESGKWYEWREDFKALSLLHPHLLFKVKREGEEAGDIEVGYFLNGECQGGKATMTLPEFVEPE